MDLLNKVEVVINKIEKLHINDPKIYDYWDELAMILAENEEATVKFLKETNDENIIDNLSSVFADVSAKLKSHNFIIVLNELEQKFPHLLLKHMVEAAKNVF